MEVRQEAENDIRLSFDQIDALKIEAFIHDFDRSIHGTASRGFESHLIHVLPHAPKLSRHSVKAQLTSKYSVIEFTYEFFLSKKLTPRTWFIGFDQIDDVLNFIKKYHHEELPTPENS